MYRDIRLKHSAFPGGSLKRFNHSYRNEAAIFFALISAAGGDISWQQAGKCPHSPRRIKHLSRKNILFQDKSSPRREISLLAPQFQEKSSPRREISLLAPQFQEKSSPRREISLLAPHFQDKSSPRREMSSKHPLLSG